VVSIAESEFTRDDAFSTATSIAIVGGLKRAAENRRPDAA
jgi:hypothetical protein